MREKIRCLLTEFYGGDNSLTGGTRYGYTILKNPPPDTEYFIPQFYKKWRTGSLGDKLLDERSVEVETKLYTLPLRRLDNRIPWEYSELQKLKVKDRDDIDLIHSMTTIASTNRPYVCSIDIDWHVTKQYPRYSTLRLGPLRRFFGKAYSKTVMRKVIRSRRLRKVLFWSNMARDAAVAHTRELECKSEVVYPGVVVQDKDEIKKRKSEKIRLCFVGTGWERKGLPLLEQAYLSLKESYDIELNVVTDVSYEKTFPGEGINRMYGLSYDETFPEVYLNSDIFVLPTRGEIFGYSVIEAMACGLPVVSTNDYAIPEMVEDGKTGYLTRYGDVKELEQKIAGLIEDGKLRKRMGESGYKRAREKFGVEVLRGNLRRVYEEAVKC